MALLVLIHLGDFSSRHSLNCRRTYYRSLGTKDTKTTQVPAPMSSASPHHCQSQSHRHRHQLHSLALGYARDRAASCQSAGVDAVCWLHPHPIDQHRASAHRPRLSAACPSFAPALCSTSLHLTSSLPCPPWPCSCLYSAKKNRRVVHRVSCPLQRKKPGARVGMSYDKLLGESKTHTSDTGASSGAGGGTYGGILKPKNNLPNGKLRGAGTFPSFSRSSFTTTRCCL